MDIAEIRKWYAEEVRVQANVSSQRIVEAFAKVPREHFLGSGPWRIKTIGTPYVDTPDDDARHLYHNVLVAIDESRGLNNGVPSWLAMTMDAASPQLGERVVHIGAGVGYYSAIWAEIVGQGGSVLAIEFDEALASRARENLSSWTNVEVVNADGSSYPLGSADVVFVNAGATHIQLSWIQSLNKGGRLIVPLTYSLESPGRLFRLTKEDQKYTIEAMQEVYIYPCVGARNNNYEAQLKSASDKMGMNITGELRFDLENKDESCWTFTEDYWISVQ